MDGRWEEYLFSPPKWPYKEGEAGAPTRHPSIDCYGYDVRQLDMLPVQKGYEQRAGENDMSRAEARQYYSQFVVYRRIMLDKGWRQRQEQMLDYKTKRYKGRKWKLRGSRSSSGDSQSSMDSGKTKVPSSPSSPSSGNDEYEEKYMLTESVEKKKEKKKSLGKLRLGLRVVLACAILGVVVLEVLAYIVIRQLVGLYERVVVWRGERGRLLRQLRSARSYDEYLETARKLDAELGNNKSSQSYDSRLLVKIAGTLRRARERAERAERAARLSGSDTADGAAEASRRAAIGLCDVLRGGAVRANVGGWEKSAGGYAGEVPREVSAYVGEVERSAGWVRGSAAVGAAEKAAVFGQMARQLGRTALCLSGGAGMGWKHLGVAQSLLENARLPGVVSGASAGALVAALLGTHTDGELRQVLRPGLAKYLTACQGAAWAGVRRWARHGHFFDAVEWAARAQVFTRGSLTFSEAFARTGRELCIACTPAAQAQAQGPWVLSHVTAPNVVVWSAVLASAGLPGVLPAMVLVEKTRAGRVRACTAGGAAWRDGSFGADIPHGHLRAGNVQFSVVSQVNPHVAVFLKEEARWWARVLKLDARKWLRVARDLRLAPRVCGQDWAQVWLQKLDGCVTVLPRACWADYAGLFADPSEASLARSMRRGREAMWAGVGVVWARQRLEAAISVR